MPSDSPLPPPPASLEDPIKTKMQLLTMTSIAAKVQHMSPHLRSVNQGTKPCHRASEFRSGKSRRVQLRYSMPQGGLSDDQFEHLASTICRHFSGASIGPDFDFSMSVLVPEAVAMLLSETCEMSYAEALKYMGGKVGCTMIKSKILIWQFSSNCRTFN